MKKTLIILGSFALLFVLLVSRLLLRENSGRVAEAEWFARELHYEFSAEVDSVRMFNVTSGRLWCRLTDGDPQVHREDSLKPFFKNHSMLYLIFNRSADSITFILPYANQVSKGDSVRLSSTDNSVRLFREGKLVTSEPLSSSLIAHGRPIYRIIN